MAELRVQVAHPAPRRDAALDFIGESLGLTVRTVTGSDVAGPVHLILGSTPDQPGDSIVFGDEAGDPLWPELLDGTARLADLRGPIPFDLVGAIGALLGDDVHADRGAGSLDRHGRLPYSASLPARAGYGDRPIVNVYVAALSDALRERFGLIGEPLWPAGKQAVVGLSHDVDQPDRYALLRSAIRPWRLRRHPRSYLRGSLRLLGARLRDPDPANSWVWDKVSDSEAAHGFRSTFFVAATPFHHARGAEIDVAYDVRERRFRPIMRTLEGGGFEIGLHTGYRAFEQPSWLAEERTRLSGAADVEVDGSRHHFWHLGPDVAATLRSHEAAGFAHDSSLAFNDHVGFRRSVALPFRPWDPTLGRPLRTLQIPTFAMDGNVLSGAGPGAAAVAGDLAGAVDGAVSTVMTLVDGIRAVNGVGSIDWHIQASVPATPEYRHWGVAYQEILAALAARPDVWVTSHREIARWVEGRADRLGAVTSRLSGAA